MKEEDIISAIVDSFEQKGLILGNHKLQAGKAVQLKTGDGDYFNICVVKLDKKSNSIVHKLR